MKQIKMFGLAVLAALMAMAFAGTGSAMAESTALCTEDTALFETVEEEEVYEQIAECPPVSRVSHVHEVSTSKAILLASPEVKCDVLFLGDVKSTENVGTPLVIEGGFTYSNCGSGCSVKEENSPLTINVLREGHELAKVTSGTGSGAGLVNVNCFGIECKYTGSGLVGHGLGPLLSEHENGDVTLSEQTVSHESGFFCPSSGKLDIQTTPLTKPVYLGGLGLEMTCLEVEAGEGFYLGDESGTCTGEDESAQGRYEMGYVLRGQNVNGTHVCARALPHRGIYLLNNVGWTQCSMADPRGVGRFILGVVRR